MGQPTLFQIGRAAAEGPMIGKARRCRKAEGDAGDAGASFSSGWYRTDASRPFEKRNFFRDQE